MRSHFFQRSLAVGVVVVVAALFLAWRGARWPLAAEVYPSEQILVGNDERRFRLVVPHSFASAPAPVVFAFHGIGDSPESMADYSGLDRLAADKGFLLVYPQATRQMWNVVATEAASADESSEVRFFDVLLDRLQKRFPIDKNRIYLVGMSNGASFAQLLAAKRSTEITAVVAHSGAPPREMDEPDRPFPILLIVGAEDSSATVAAMKSAAEHYRQKGHEAECLVLDGIGHEWAKQSNERIWTCLAGQRP